MDQHDADRTVSGCGDAFDRRPAAVHATAVAIGSRALLIRAPSKAGKSRLALGLIAVSTRRRPIVLVGDDRVLLSRVQGSVVVRPHPRIAGFIERRGLGIVAVPFVSEALVGCVVDLVEGIAEPAAIGPKTTCLIGRKNFPVLAIVRTIAIADQRDAVLGWWSGIMRAA